MKDIVDAIFSLDIRVFEVDSLDVRTAARVYDPKTFLKTAKL